MTDSSQDIAVRALGSCEKRVQDLALLARCPSRTRGEAPVPAPHQNKPIEHPQICDRLHFEYADRRRVRPPQGIREL